MLSDARGRMRIQAHKSTALGVGNWLEWQCNCANEFWTITGSQAAAQLPVWAHRVRLRTWPMPITQTQTRGELLATCLMDIVRKLPWDATAGSIDAHLHSLKQMGEWCLVRTIFTSPSSDPMTPDRSHVLDCSDDMEAHTNRNSNAMSRHLLCNHFLLIPFILFQSPARGRDDQGSRVCRATVAVRSQ